MAVITDSRLYLSQSLDRARAAIIAFTDALASARPSYSWDEEQQTYDVELAYHVLGEADDTELQRAKDLIPTLQAECEEKAHARRTALKKAMRKPPERKQTDLEKRNRVTLFGFHLQRLLQVFPGTTVPDSLWGRLWAKVTIPEGPGVLAQCWLWQGSRVVIVCRLICEWFHGPAPTEKHEAGHTCPTGEEALCCNPTHLAWQTREENEDHKRRPLRTGVDVPFVDISREPARCYCGTCGYCMQRRREEMKA